MQKSLDYYVNDYQVQDLPESNPLRKVIDEFVTKR